MCELFGINSARPIHANDLLKEFFTHAEENPHGWGLAVYGGSGTSIEKEPVKATKSLYLKERLKAEIEAENLIAHVRLATMGSLSYENSHPFLRRDATGRYWTLAHNGTLFDFPEADRYFYQQKGDTDSERFLLYIMEHLDCRAQNLDRELLPEERFALIDQIIAHMAEGNKLNLILYDGEYMYVHSNYANSLYLNKTPDTALFATKPLKDGNWEPMPITTLCVYKDGQEVYRGNPHGHEFRDDMVDPRFVFATYSEL